jgi:hypothetical protein
MGVDSNEKGALCAPFAIYGPWYYNLAGPDVPQSKTVNTPIG